MSTVASPSSRAPINVMGLTMILGALTAFAPFATDMYLSSFSSIANSLHADLGEVQITLSVFFFGLAMGQLFYGPLIDRFGRRKPLLAGIAVFMVTSLLIVMAPDIATFTGLRLLQALGGCAGMIVSRAIIRDLFDETASAHVLSSMMLVQGLGPIIAPVLGGYILVVAGWRAVFVFLLLFGAVCFLSTLIGVPETLAVERRHKTNFIEIMRVFGRLLRQRDFIVPTLSGGLAMSSMFAFISGSPFVFMELHGVSQQHYGWLFGLNALGMIAASQINRVLLGYFSPRVIFRGALGLNMAAATAVLLLASTPSLPVLMLPLYLCLAMNPLMGATATAIAMAASKEHAGSASSIIGVMQFGLASLASALVGLLHNGTAYPMAGVIMGCSLAAGLVLLAKPGRL